jgi:hypothetical protein
MSKFSASTFKGLEKSGPFEFISWVHNIMQRVQGLRPKVEREF